METTEGTEGEGTETEETEERWVGWFLRVGRAWRTGNEPSGEGRDRPPREPTPTGFFILILFTVPEGKSRSDGRTKGEGNGHRRE